MGKASRSKGPARVKAPARRGRTGFVVAVVAIFAVGIGLVVAAKSGTGAGSVAGERPGLNDHWHAAYVVDQCGTNLPNLAQPPTLIGVHTHSDGLIHVEPYVTGSALDRGHNATLARFAQGEPGFKLTSSEVQIPGGHLMKNGDKCDGKDPGKVIIRQWPDATKAAFKDYSDPKDVKIIDGSAITVAFVPPGSAIGKPPSIGNLSNPNAGEAG